MFANELLSSCIPQTHTVLPEPTSAPLPQRSCVKKNTVQNRSSSKRNSITVVSNRGAYSDGKTKIIGTSMVRDMGFHCYTQGLNACSYPSPGALIDDIIPKVQFYFGDHDTTSNIVLHAGGNDLERDSVTSVSTKMDRLIQAVREKCPNANIILCALSPRRQDAIINMKIAWFNDILRSKMNSNKAIFFADCVPMNINMYKPDRIHFNTEGQTYYASKLATVVRDINFPPLRQHHVL